ncbi:complex 1 protein-domain-containing protein [Aspergillus crustosus]
MPPTLLLESLEFLHLTNDLVKPVSLKQFQTMARFSGLQREVLSLYRKCLRGIRKKPIESRSNFKSYARTEFEKHIHISKKDFNAIEYLLRKGARQLEMYSSPGIRNIR